MEGLIPMVYKSLKKSKTRRRYECLSSGVAQTYKIEDFYVKEEHQDHYIDKYLESAGNNRVPGLHAAHHRRCNSVHVDAHAASFAKGDEEYEPRRLVRFRSHRMFSCVTGE